MSTGWALREDHDREQTARYKRILEAAREVFEKRGYSAATVAEIAQKARMSRAAFYLYFSSKNDVFIRLAELVRDEFEESQSLKSLTDDPDAWGPSVTAYFDVMVKDYGLITVLDHQAISDKEIADIWLGIREKVTERGTRHIARLRDQGAITPVAEPWVISVAAVGMIERFALYVATSRMSRDTALREILGMYSVLTGSAVPPKANDD